MVADNNVSTHAVEQALEQAIADAERIDLRTQGKADFNVFSYSPWSLDDPDRIPFLGEQTHTVDSSAQLLAGVESEQHKVKRLLAQLAAQPAHPVHSTQAASVLISKSRILHVCDLVPTDSPDYADMKRVRQALRHSDDQCEHTAKHLFYNKTLQRKLRELDGIRTLSHWR